MVLIKLTEMKEGDLASIYDINGGYKFHQRVETLGIRVGVKVKKLSSQVMRGPISIKIGNTRIAVGYGMAQKIIVKK